ncbi:conserved hypothetical protein [Histoplasma capsulatum G186AR]|uniref:Uncharacterized protein n=2 Tax=Ajellomyces capsulatus TaxID=5037 RepID=C0NJQ5_AJECG|nr:uncharacterized protein HCBG_03385 [Histoplasma capsulatum G186AR]EEH08096.1 conserved hypothetical protein [Histoplasma capsulatum G186AR]KAG5299580.1 hypothetical protein I7I52_09946 [Histoplasma capsulatum]QSS67794.1 hypothetical protein I7I50_06980 [Histoplasma capsulatum G186AR]
MPPSTVFSYLRREHRRPSPPATSPSPTTHPSTALPVSSHLPPQLSLPDSPYSPKLSSTIGEPTSWFGTPPLQQHQQQSEYNNINNNRHNNYCGKLENGSDTKKKQIGNNGGSGRENITSLSASPRVSIPPLMVRPHSAGNGDSKKPLPSADSQQQAAMLRPDHHDSAPHSSKPTSPWKLTFGKNILSDSSKGSGGIAGGYSPGSNNNNSVRMKPSSPDSSGVERSSNAFIPGRELAKQEGNSSSIVISNNNNNSNYSRRDASSHDTHHEPAPSRAGKTRLNLLNPMALLARRRSGQTLTPRLDEIGASRLGLPALPDDYDPRIRGNRFHDFSAPRPRPNVPMMKQQAVDSQPVNVQDFQNKNLPPVLLSPADSLKNENKESPVNSDRSHTETPSTGRTPSSARLHSAVEPHDKPLPLRQASSRKQQGHRASMSSDLRSSSTRSKASTVYDGSFQPSGLPRHLTSSASRFSFDMANGDSASQERIMEEKHKQKEAAKRAKAQLDRANDSDSEEFDYDAMMDDDGLEERIPGVNADADSGDEFDGFTGQGHVFGHPGNQLFVPVLPPVLSNPMSPLDLNYSTPLSPVNDMPTPLMISPNPVFAGLSSGTGGIFPPNGPLANNTAFSQNDTDASTAPTEPGLQRPSPLFSQGVEERSSVYPESDEDDLYFDDGMIDDILGDIDGEKFDESVFDDETSHLYERKPKCNPQLQTGPGSDGIAVGNDQQIEEYSVNDGDDEEDGKVPLAAQSSLMHHNISLKNGGISEVTGRLTEQEIHPSTIRGLTQGNLEKYHSALAKAANEAALNGRFERSGSVSERSSDAGNAPLSPDSHPGLTADDSRVSQNVDPMAFEEVFDDFDYNDDYLDDDAIIAAANAEALENDDEGFYGQEFGFYPQALASNCDGQMVLGGYFGTRSVEGITRSHSGRVNFQEPSLTPITERSEWSTRNSIISLTAHAAAAAAGGAGASFTNPPPLAHLGDLGNIDDQMNALMKLRRGAWGGSNGSLRSSAASHGGSPVAATMAAAASSRGSFTSFHDMLAEQGRSGSSGSNHNTNTNNHSNNSNTVLTGSPVATESTSYGSSSSFSHPQQQVYSYPHSHPYRNHHQQQNPHHSDNDFSPLSSSSTYNYITTPSDKDKPLSPLKYSEQKHHHHDRSRLPLEAEPDETKVTDATATATATSDSKEDNSTAASTRISQHSRANSTTESISYVKETDEAGGDRWVLERRRTSESGEREVVEREVMASGLI